MQRKVTPGSVFLYGTLVVLSLFFLMPAYMAVVTALKLPADISLPSAWELPVTFNWASFSDAIKLLKPNFINSLILTVCATAGSTILGSLNGYVFSKWKFKGSEVVFTLFLFGMFIPYQVILIPLFQTLRAMDLYGGLPGLSLSHVDYRLPIPPLIFRQFYVGVSTVLNESARLEGAGFFSIHQPIVFTLSVPGF